MNNSRKLKPEYFCILLNFEKRVMKKKLIQLSCKDNTVQFNLCFRPNECVKSSIQRSLP